MKELCIYSTNLNSVMDQLAVGVTAILSFHHCHADLGLTGPFTDSSSPMTSSGPAVASAFIDKYAMVENCVCHEPLNIFNSPSDDIRPVAVRW